MDGQCLYVIFATFVVPYVTRADESIGCFYDKKLCTSVVPECHDGAIINVTDFGWYTKDSCVAVKSNCTSCCSFNSTDNQVKTLNVVSELFSKVYQVCNLQKSCTPFSNLQPPSQGSAYVLIVFSCTPVTTTTVTTTKTTAVAPTQPDGTVTIPVWLIYVVVFSVLGIAGVVVLICLCKWLCNKRQGSILPTSDPENERIVNDLNNEQLQQEQREDTPAYDNFLASQQPKEISKKPKKAVNCSKKKFIVHLPPNKLPSGVEKLNAVLESVAQERADGEDGTLSENKCNQLKEEESMNTDKRTVVRSESMVNKLKIKDEMRRKIPKAVIHPNTNLLSDKMDRVKSKSKQKKSKETDIVMQRGIKSNLQNGDFDKDGSTTSAEDSTTLSTDANNPESELDSSDVRSYDEATTDDEESVSDARQKHKIKIYEKEGKRHKTNNSFVMSETDKTFDVSVNEQKRKKREVSRNEATTSNIHNGCHQSKYKEDNNHLSRQEHSGVANSNKLKSSLMNQEEEWVEKRCYENITDSKSEEFRKAIQRETVSDHSRSKNKSEPNECESSDLCTPEASPKLFKKKKQKLLEKIAHVPRQGPIATSSFKATEEKQQHAAFQKAKESSKRNETHEVSKGSAKYDAWHDHKQNGIQLDRIQQNYEQFEEAVVKRGRVNLNRSMSLSEIDKYQEEMQSRRRKRKYQSLRQARQATVFDVIQKLDSEPKKSILKKSKSLHFKTFVRHDPETSTLPVSNKRNSDDQETESDISENKNNILKLDADNIYQTTFHIPHRPSTPKPFQDKTVTLPIKPLIAKVNGQKNLSIKDNMKKNVNTPTELESPPLVTDRSEMYSLQVLRDEDSEQQNRGTPYQTLSKTNKDEVHIQTCSKSPYSGTKRCDLDTMKGNPDSAEYESTKQLSKSKRSQTVLATTAHNLECETTKSTVMNSSDNICVTGQTTHSAEILSSNFHVRPRSRNIESNPWDSEEDSKESLSEIECAHFPDIEQLSPIFRESPQKNDVLQTKASHMKPSSWEEDTDQSVVIDRNIVINGPNPTNVGQKFKKFQPCFEFSSGAMKERHLTHTESRGRRDSLICATDEDSIEMADYKANLTNQMTTESNETVYRINDNQHEFTFSYPKTTGGGSFPALDKVVERQSMYTEGYKPLAERPKTPLERSMSPFEREHFPTERTKTPSEMFKPPPELQRNLIEKSVSEDEHWKTRVDEVKSPFGHPLQSNDQTMQLSKSPIVNTEEQCGRNDSFDQTAVGKRQSKSTVRPKSALGHLVGTQDKSDYSKNNTVVRSLTPVSHARNAEYFNKNVEDKEVRSADVLEMSQNTFAKTDWSNKQMYIINSKQNNIEQTTNQSLKGDTAAGFTSGYVDKSENLVSLSQPKGIQLKTDWREDNNNRQLPAANSYGFYDEDKSTRSTTPNPFLETESKIQDLTERFYTPKKSKHDPNRSMTTGPYSAKRPKTPDPKLISITTGPYFAARPKTPDPNLISMTTGPYTAPGPKTPDPNEISMTTGPYSAGRPKTPDPNLISMATGPYLAGRPKTPDPNLIPRSERQNMFEAPRPKQSNSKISTDRFSFSRSKTPEPYLTKQPKDVQLKTQQTYLENKSELSEINKSKNQDFKFSARSKTPDPTSAATKYDKSNMIMGTLRSKTPTNFKRSEITKIEQLVLDNLILELKPKHQIATINQLKGSRHIDSFSRNVQENINTYDTVLDASLPIPLGTSKSRPILTRRFKDENVLPGRAKSAIPSDRPRPKSAMSVRSSRAKAEDESLTIIPNYSERKDKNEKSSFQKLPISGNVQSRSYSKSSRTTMPKLNTTMPNLIPDERGDFDDSDSELEEFFANPEAEVLRFDNNSQSFNRTFAENCERVHIAYSNRSALSKSKSFKM